MTVVDEQGSAVTRDPGGGSAKTEHSGRDFRYFAVVRTFT